MSCQTFERQDVKDASNTLITENAEYLIKYIYSNAQKSPYNDPVIRVGMVIRIIFKVSSSLDADVLEPVITDLEYLVKNERNPVQRKIYSEELDFVQHYTIKCDLITLNNLTAE